MKKSVWTKYERLQLFTERAEELKKSRIFSKERLDFGVTIQANSFGTKVQVRGIDEEDFRAFLSRLRPFLSEKDPTFLNEIYVISEKLIIDEQVLVGIRNSRREWKQERKEEFIEFIFNNKRASKENVVDW